MAKTIRLLRRYQGEQEFRTMCSVTGQKLWSTFDAIITGHVLTHVAPEALTPVTAEVILVDNTTGQQCGHFHRPAQHELALTKEA